MMRVRLIFHGAAREVTGSCFLLEGQKGRLLVDCGLFQGDKRTKERNYGPFPFDPAAIDGVVLTHAHIDHSGLLPKLIKHGFRGSIYATGPTVELCEVMLPDSGYIQEMEVERKNRKLSRAGKPLLEPIYTAEDARQGMSQFHSVDYQQLVQVAPGFSARFWDAGHILGSAAVEIRAKENDREMSLVFSGDLGGWNRPVVRDPEVPGDAQWLIMESTYGDRLRESYGNQLEQLAQIIADTFRRGGNVVIPAFAVERTQALLYGLHRLVVEGRIPQAQLFLDSPLAIAATRVFCNNPEVFDERTTEFSQQVGTCPFYIPGMVMAESTAESIAINKIKQGAIIISASGMCDAGRIKHHLKHNLWRPESSVVLVGYQAQGTLGRQLVDGNPLVRIHGEEIKVRAQIHSIEGFSAHGDQLDLLRWASSFPQRPRKVFLVHGEEEALETLADLLRREMGVPVEIPSLSAAYELEEEARLLAMGRPSSPETISLRSSLWRTYRSLADRIEELQRAGANEEQLHGVIKGLEGLEEEVSQLVSRAAEN
jgi:metallo-beta-lactamase family protein